MSNSGQLGEWGDLQCPGATSMQNRNAIYDQIRQRALGYLGWSLIGQPPTRRAPYISLDRTNTGSANVDVGTP